VFALEALCKVVDKLVVKVLTTQMGVTGGGLHLEDTLLNCQEGHIEGPSSKIEDENVVLTDNFLVKTVCNGSSSGLIDDTKNIHSGDGAGIGILCSLSLGVIEVGRDGDGRSSGLVDDMKNIHSGDGAGIGILHSQSLGVIEVGKDGDDGVSDVVAQVRLSGLLHLKEDHQCIKNTTKVY